jgi:hypothetical protein
VMRCMLLTNKARIEKCTDAVLYVHTYNKLVLLLFITTFASELTKRQG